MKATIICLILIMLTALSSCTLAADNGQLHIDYIDAWPDTPNASSNMRDWNATAHEYFALFSDTHARGQYLPLGYPHTLTQPTSGGYSGSTWSTPSYLGRPGWKTTDSSEALTYLGAVLGATLSGIDVRNYAGHNWLGMCSYYYSEIAAPDGTRYGYVCNNANARNSTGSWWYDLAPMLLFAQISALQHDATLTAQTAKSVDTLSSIAPLMHNNWRHTGFDVAKWATVDEGWREPDAGIGIAYIAYLSYKQLGTARYLATARACMNDMQNYFANPYYEILGAYGPITAARLNAEQSGTYAVGKFLDYILTDSCDSRPGWGVINYAFGRYPAYGLCGSTTDSDGYAFSMNTFVTAAAVAPVVRYNPEYCAAIGKWLTNIAYNANLFYPDALPAANQAFASFSSTNNITCLAYEGLRNKGAQQPFATGDSAQYYSLYSSWGAGLAAALFKPTNIPGIVRIDALATDIAHDAAYPTYLYYNPWNIRRYLTVDVPQASCRLYDAVSKRYLTDVVTGSANIAIGAHSALLLVCVPASANNSVVGNTLVADKIVVDYNIHSISTSASAPPQHHYTDWATFNDSSQWTVVDNAAIAQRGSVLNIANVKDTWGMVKRSVTVDLLSAPRLRVTIQPVGNNTKWALKVANAGESYYLQGDNSRSGTFSFSLPALTGWTGVQRFDIQIFPLGGSGCSLDITDWQWGK